MNSLEYINENGDTVHIPLTDGKISIGRNPSNILHIAHDSVSGFHGEIDISKGVAVLRDLGSTNGTFVDEEPITEQVLHAAQQLRFGDVWVQVLPDHSGTPSAPLPVARRSQTTHRPTRTPLASASKMLFCPRCKKDITSDSTKKVSAGITIINFCPHCNERCISATEKSKLYDKPLKKTFANHIREAFSYPFRENGWIILITGTFMFTAINVLSFISRYAGFILGLVAIIVLVLFSVGYLYVYIKNVISESAQGENDPPSWPEFSNFYSDAICPFFQLLGLTLTCMLPGCFALGLLPDGINAIAAIALFILALVYFPMALLAVAMFDTLSALNPLLILNSITRILRHYSIVCILLVVLLGVQYISSKIDGSLLIRLLTKPFTEFLSLYLFIVMGRILGMMYFVNRRKLGWFG